MSEVYVVSNEQLTNIANAIRTKGETTEYSYMQADKACENEKYHFISYSDIVTSTSSEN